MSKPMVERTAPGRMPTPPAIRLVHAFKEAVESSQPAGNPSDEAFVVESLLIAAEASFAALSRFADLWHEGIYGESPTSEAGEEQLVLDGYDAWLEAADPLLIRLKRLREADVVNLNVSGYESESGKRFQAQFDDATAILSDAVSRRGVERMALRADQLAELAARLEPRRESYDEGTSP